MAYSRNDLRNEINQIVEAALANNQPVIVAWLVQSVLAAHPEPGLSEFSAFARFVFVNDEADRCVRRFKEPEPGELDEMTLPGFKRLQKAYRIERDGDSMIVPIEAMTDAELEARAAEHDAMARGHRRHANEIRRYLKARGKARRAG